MSLLPFIHFITFILLLYYLVYIIFKNPKALINRICAAFIFCSTLWSFAYIFVHNPYYSKNTAQLFFNISSFGWAGFASLFLWFILVFSQNKKLLKKKWLYLILFGIPLVFIYKQWTHFLFVDLIEKSYGWKPVPGRSIWPFLFLSYAFVFMVTALYFNFRFMRRTRDPLLKKQAKIIFLVTIIVFTCGSITDLILPVLNIHVIPNVANIFALIWTFGGVYAMVKYKFLTITPATAADNIISTMYDCLILLSMKGEIVTVNKATSNLLGYKEEELKGKPVNILFREEDSTDDFFKKIAGEGNLRNKDLIFKTRAGNEIPVLFSDSILRDETGNAAGIVCVAKDISERKKLEEEIFKGEKLESIGLLAGGIAHDFNNLLAGIMGYLSQLEEEISPGTESFQSLTNAREAALKAADLARKFISLSPGGWLKKGNVKLSEIVKYVEDSELPKAGINVMYNIEIPGDLMFIYGDEEQLIQVMRNLLLNALEAIEAGPGGRDARISVRAENIIAPDVKEVEEKSTFPLKKGKYIKILIGDNGCGMPAENIGKIFDPYFSTKDTVTRKGMGLGLTLCYSIIKKHDGHIDVESEEGEGTTVTLYLPAVTGPMA